MKLLKEGSRDIKLHPEVREQFHELLRFHFSPFRKGKDVHQIRQEMRTKDAADQKALLAGNCEIQTVVTHQPSCDSRTGGFIWSLPCDCTPTRAVKFVEIKETIPYHHLYNDWLTYCFDKTPPKDDDTESGQKG